MLRSSWLKIGFGDLLSDSWTRPFSRTGTMIMVFLEPDESPDTVQEMIDKDGIELALKTIGELRLTRTTPASDSVSKPTPRRSFWSWSRSPLSWLSWSSSRTSNAEAECSATS